MTNPLPTSKEVEAEAYGISEAGCDPDPLRAAQHAASRKATLEEVYAKWTAKKTTVATFVDWLKEAK